MRFSFRTICCMTVLAVPVLASCTTGPAAPDDQGTAAPITSPVPAPSGGSVTEKVEPRPVERASEAAIGQEAQVADKVKVTVEDVKAIETSAGVPGDVAGPAVQFKVSVANGSSEPVEVDNVVVNVTGSDAAPGVLFQGSPTQQLAGKLEAGSSASGTYVFRVAPSARKPVKIEVSLNPSLPVVSFNGDLP